MKAILAPVYFRAINEREQGEFSQQLDVLKDCLLYTSRLPCSRIKNLRSWKF